MNVLIVDDDPIAITLLKDLLTDAGHEVSVALSGEDALRALENNTFPLVITDWLMPGVSGLELCRQIRGAAHARYIYIVMLTARDTTEDKIAGLSAGADDFISKPFDPTELQVRLRVAQRILTLETRDVTIFAMAKLAESRDPETGAHLERIRSYCRLLACELRRTNAFPGRIDSEFIKLLHETSPLHDIGKVGVPDCVLLKPGRLSESEFEIMKTHTIVGAETLAAAADHFPGARFLAMARDIARSHHEHWDGTGYPDGLAGEDIPLCARIVALADVYDALTSRRVYKDAFTHEVARRIINEGRGSHFDPRIVNAFNATEDRFRQIATQSCDHVDSARHQPPRVAIT